MGTSGDSARPENPGTPNRQPVTAGCRMGARRSRQNLANRAGDERQRTKDRHGQRTRRPRRSSMSRKSTSAGASGNGTWDRYRPAGATSDAMQHVGSSTNRHFGAVGARPCHRGRQPTLEERRLARMRSFVSNPHARTGAGASALAKRGNDVRPNSSIDRADGPGRNVVRVHQAEQLIATGVPIAPHPFDAALRRADDHCTHVVEHVEGESERSSSFMVLRVLVRAEVAVLLLLPRRQRADQGRRSSSGTRRSIRPRSDAPARWCRRSAPW